MSSHHQPFPWWMGWSTSSWTAAQTEPGKLISGLPMSRPILAEHWSSVGPQGWWEHPKPWPRHPSSDAWPLSLHVDSETQGTLRWKVILFPGGNSQEQGQWGCKSLLHPFLHSLMGARPSISRQSCRFTDASLTAHGRRANHNSWHGTAHDK